MRNPRHFIFWLCRFPLLLAGLLVLFIAGSPVAGQNGISSRRVNSRLLVSPDHPLHARVRQFASEQPVADLALERLLQEPELDLVRLGQWLENVSRALEPDLDSIDPADIFAFNDFAQCLTREMAAAGLRYRKLDERLKRFAARGAAGHTHHKSAETVSPPSPPPARGYLRSAINEVIIRQHGTDDPEFSNLLRLRYDGHNRDHGFTWHLSLLNPDTKNRHYSWQTPMEYDEAVDEAYLSFTLHRFPFTRIDIGRFPEELLGGSLFQGCADGVRGVFQRGPWELKLAAEFLEPRFRKNGFGDMDLPAPDSAYLTLGREINHGRVELGAFLAELSGSTAGGGNWTGFKALKTPIPIVAAPFSARWIAGEKTWNRHSTARGFIEMQDMEDWSAGGIMGRSFEGMQLGLDLDWDPLGETHLFFCGRLREIDHLQLGWRDDLTRPDSLGSFRRTRDGRGNWLTEHFNNSEYASIGLERLVRLKPHYRPFVLRLWLESLSGWKDLDTVTPFRQDNVFDQQAAAALVEYTTPGDWTWRLRVRGVQYRQDDWDFATQALFLPGSVPRDRVDVDLRILSPAF